MPCGFPPHQAGRVGSSSTSLAGVSCITWRHQYLKGESWRCWGWPCGLVVMDSHGYARVRLPRQSSQRPQLDSAPHGAKSSSAYQVDALALTSLILIFMTLRQTFPITTSSMHRPVLRDRKLLTAQPSHPGRHQHKPSCQTA